MSQRAAQTGFLFAVAAYTMWGFAPMYFKLLQAVPALDILVHRILWSAALLFILIIAAGHLGKVKIALKDRKVLLILLVSGLLLAGNWLLFIWAVNNDRLLDASLGYYINPLLNVLLGRVFLAEILRPMQKVAVAIAFAGVTILIASFGQLPWIALVLAASFGVYGLLRKQVAVDSLPGLFIETMMMLPFALIYCFWFMQSGLLVQGWQLNVTLLCAGIVTTAPLLCFTAAARRIRYSTLGFFQYIGPSIMFLLAVLLYKEPLDLARLITFACVWLALLIFSADSIRHFQKTKVS